MRKEGTLIQRLKFTCRPGQKSVFMASLLLLQGQEGCFTVQEYFHSVLLNLACKTAQNRSDRKQNWTNEQSDSPGTLGPSLTFAQCSCFSDSSQSAAPGTLRSRMIQPTIHRWCLHIWLKKSHWLFAPVLVPDQSPVNVALTSGGAAVFSSSAHLIGQFQHAFITVIAISTPKQTSQFPVPSETKLGTRTVKLAGWEVTGLGGAPGKLLTALPPPSKWGSFAWFLSDHCHE